MPDDQDQRRRRARKLAGDAIDSTGDAAATADNRQIRKRDLLDRPEEFDRLRIDRPQRGKPIEE